MTRDEFVFSDDGKHYFTIPQLLKRCDEILQNEHDDFWSNVAKGYLMVFVQKPKKYTNEPDQIHIGTITVQDAILKYG